MCSLLFVPLSPLCLAFHQTELLKSPSPPPTHFQVNTHASKAQNLALQTSPKALGPTTKFLYLKPLHKLRFPTALTMTGTNASARRSAGRTLCVT
jgi:hypothetical protein